MRSAAGCGTRVYGIRIYLRAAEPRPSTTDDAAMVLSGGKE